MSRLIELDTCILGTTTLGSLIQALSRIDAEEDAAVRFDFGYMHPTLDIGSYRGFYDHLALDYDRDGVDVTRKQLINLLEGAINKTYTGYKGGEYTMTRETPVWVDHYSDASGTAIVAVERIYDTLVMLHTKHQEV